MRLNEILDSIPTFRCGARQSECLGLSWGYSYGFLTLPIPPGARFRGAAEPNAVGGMGTHWNDRRNAEVARPQLFCVRAEMTGGPLQVCGVGAPP